jgi:hypothetical protein
MPYDIPSQCDWSTAQGNRRALDTEIQEAFKHTGLFEYQFPTWSNAFRHAREGRTDLYLTGHSAYDMGYEAGAGL